MVLVRVITTHLSVKLVVGIIESRSEHSLGAPGELVRQRNVAGARLGEATAPRDERGHALVLMLHPLEDTHGGPGQVSSPFLRLSGPTWSRFRGQAHIRRGGGRLARVRC